MPVAVTYEGETVTRLLDAAERLFAEKGFSGLGMRSLAEAAEANLGAATYHFGTKENLYKEAFLRRFMPAWEKRQLMLEQAQAEAGDQPVAVEKIIESMLRPPFEVCVEHPHFAKFMARNLFAAPSFMEDLMLEKLNHCSDRFVQALAKALPNVELSIIKNQINFCRGALLIATTAPGKCLISSTHEPVDHEATLQELITFTTAGFLHTPNTFE